MRWLLGAVLIAAAGWSALWFAGSAALDRAVRGGLAQAAPFVSEAGVAVAGFPNRFDLTVTEPRFADPVSGAGYAAPFLQVLSLSYRPWHLIAAFPPEQRLTWPDGGLTLGADKLQASLVLRPTTALPLDRFTLVGEALALTPDAGAGASIAALRLATRPDPTRADTHEVALEVAGIEPDPVLLARLPPGTDLPPRTELLRLVAFAGFSAPLDRFAGQTRPAITRLDLDEIAFRWGGIVLAGEGSVAPDAAGLAEGRITLRLDGWRQAIDAAVALGALRPEIAPTWTEFARRLAEAGGSPDRLDLTLSFARGRTSLGPFPLGPAPRLAP